MALARLMAASTLLAAASMGSAALAQSMTPMIGQVRSLSDEFAVRVRPANPYGHKIRVNVRVYDRNFRPVPAAVRPASFTMGGGTTRPVLVRVPFEGRRSRRVRICTESIPFPNAKIAMRTQICGRFFAMRVR